MSILLHAPHIVQCTSHSRNVFFTTLDYKTAHLLSRSTTWDFTCTATTTIYNTQQSFLIFYCISYSPDWWHITQNNNDEGPISKGGEEKGWEMGCREGKEWHWREEQETQRIGSHPMSEILKIPWSQNWSDWRGWQHKCLLRAATVQRQKSGQNFTFPGTFFGMPATTHITGITLTLALTLILTLTLSLILTVTLPT